MTAYACGHVTIAPWASCPVCTALPSVGPCTCGSGGHPRACQVHPDRFEAHCEELDACAAWDHTVRPELRALVTAFLERHPGMREDIAVDLLRDALAIADVTQAGIDPEAPADIVRGYLNLQAELRCERGRAWEAWALLSNAQDWFQAIRGPQRGDLAQAYQDGGRVVTQWRMRPGSAMAFVVAGLAHFLDEQRAPNCVEAVMDWEGAPLLVEVRRKGKKSMAMLRAEAQQMARAGAELWLRWPADQPIHTAMTAWARRVLAELGAGQDTPPSPPPSQGNP